MKRRSARVDDNQPAIVKELRQIPGFSVESTASMGNGFPDIAVGYLGLTGLYEIKDPAKPPSKRKLTDDEKEFHNAWRGHIRVVETTEQIVSDMRQLATHTLGRTT